MSEIPSAVWGCRITSNTPPTPNIWTPYTVTDKIKNAVGGEAALYRLADHHGAPRIAKIYKDAAKAILTTQALDSLAYLVKNNETLSADLPFVAWPIEILFTAQKPAKDQRLATLAGITMPEIVGANTLATYTSIPNLRVKENDATALFVASELAGHLKKLHANNIVVCDFNPGNVLVSRTFKKVAFVDADAYQHALRPQIFTKANYTPGYASPAALNGLPGPRTPDDDNFVLAIHLFQLLIDGGHPFQHGPRYDPSGRITPDDNIKARRFPYSNYALYCPPGETPDIYAALNPDLRAMFELAFVQFKPPTAQQWQDALPAFQGRILVAKPQPPPPTPLPTKTLKPLLKQKTPSPTAKTKNTLIAQILARAPTNTDNKKSYFVFFLRVFWILLKYYSKRLLAYAITSLIFLFFAAVRLARYLAPHAGAWFSRLGEAFIRSLIQAFKRNRKPYTAVIALATFLFAFVYIKPVQTFIAYTIGSTRASVPASIHLNLQLPQTKSPSSPHATSSPPATAPKAPPSPPLFKDTKVRTIPQPAQPQPEILPWLAHEFPSQPSEYSFQKPLPPIPHNR